jgi:hypothetical protein
MHSSLPDEPIDRNIKAVDVAEIGDIAKIVETATRTDTQSTTRALVTTPTTAAETK